MLVLHFLSKDVGIGSSGHEQFENDVIKCVISFVDNKTNSENGSDEIINCF